MQNIHLNFFFPEIYNINPYIKLEEYIPTNKVLDGGFVYRLGVKYPITLPKFLKQQVIDFDISIGGHDGAFGRRSERISSGKLGLSSKFKIWKATVSPEINFQKRFGYGVDRGLTEDKVWYGIRCSIPLY